MNPASVATANPKDIAAARRLRKKWAADPVGFFEEVLGVRYVDPPCGIEGCTRCTPFTRLIAESVRDHRRTIVSAAHDTGKTHAAGAIFWWWMLSFAPAVVVTSSSTDRQVKRGIWKEIRTLYYRSDFLRAHFPEPNLMDWSPGNPDWYGFGFSTKADQAEAGATRVHGQHARHLLLIFDEATAVDRLIWDAAKGSLTQAHNHWLVLANPTDPTSEFASVWRSGRGWNRIEIDARETPNLIHGDGTNPYLITQQWVDEYVGDNGEDHPLVQARVHGKLPDDSVVTLIGYGDLRSAYDREPPEKPAAGWPHPTIGVDVARFGDDLTSIYVVRDAEILHAERYGKKDTVFTANRVMQVARDHGLGEGTAHRITIDDTGVGGGVTDILRANGWRVRSEDFGSKAKDPERFLNRRTELWWKLRDWIRDEAALASLSPEERRRLEADLPGVLYKVEARGARTVQILEKKSDMKKRLGHSPDNGDALALALAGRGPRNVLDYRGLVSKEDDPASTAWERIQARDDREDRENRLKKRRRRREDRVLDDVWSGRLGGWRGDAAIEQIYGD